MYLYRSKKIFFKFSLYRKLLAEVTFFFKEHIIGWALYELAGDEEFEKNDPETIF
jgi:hypothetical protein